MKNKGFTLIELLIAMAISSVILFMVGIMLTQGTKMYKNQSESIDVQNELQIVRNQLNEALMSAKSIVVVNAGEDIVIYTGEVDASTNKLAAEKTEGGSTVTTERIITYDRSESKLYISNSHEYAISEGNQISSYVTDFSIAINEDCLRTPEGGVATDSYYVNPVSVEVTMKIANNDKEAEGHIDVRVRNLMERIAIYKCDSRDTLLLNVTNVKEYKVK